MDTFILLAFNGLAHMSASLDGIGTFLSSNDQTIIEIAVALCFLIRFVVKPTCRKNWMMAASAIISGGIMSWIAGTSFFVFFHRARPSLVLPAVTLFGKISAAQQYASFPSGHAMFFFSLAAAVFFFNRESGIAVGIVAAVLSLSKLFVGVHWPSDLLVGAILGAAIGSLVAFLVRLAVNALMPSTPKKGGSDKPMSPAATVSASK